MKVFENGKYRDITAEELDEQARNAAEEKRRPLTESEVTALLICQQINTLDVDDQTALRMMSYYPGWEELAEKSYYAEKAGYKFVYGGKLYKTIQESHTFALSWVPDNGTESLYVRIDEVHDGSKYDPIPYEGNMALTNGLYYSQDGVTYLCTRDTGTAVYNALSELVGLYVEVVA